MLWLVGHALVRGRLPTGLSGLEALAARLAIGLAALSVGAVVLADTGLHAPWSVATLAAALVAIGFACNPSAGDGWRGFSRTDAVLAAGALVTVALALPGFEWSLGGRDAGTYVNEVVQIQERGAVEVTEPSLATVPPALRGYLGRSGLYPGEDAGRSSAEIVRLGFHTWPAVRAAAGYATDDEGAWSLAVIAGLALLLTAFTARRLAPRHGEVAAVATALLLLCSVAFSWYARFPMTELPALAMLAGGIWLWAVSAPVQNAYGAATAGVLLGLTFLYRPDGLFTLAAVALLAVWLVVTGRFGRAAWALTIATLATAIVAFVHIARFAWGYFASNWDRHAHAVAYVAPLALVALALVAVLAARRRRSVDAFLDRHTRAVGIALAVVAAGGVGLIVGGRAGARLERRHLGHLVRRVVRGRAGGGGHRTGDGTGVRARPRRGALPPGCGAARDARHLRRQRPRPDRPLLGGAAAGVVGAAAARGVRRRRRRLPVGRPPAARGGGGRPRRDRRPGGDRPAAGAPVRRVPRLDPRSSRRSTACSARRTRS